MFSGLKATTPLAVVALMVCSGALATDITAEPELAPPSAKVAVGIGVADLAALFAKECIQQRNLNWARAESARIVGTCRAVPAGAGETGDCEEDLAGRVSWLVPTSQGTDVLIEMAFDPAKDTKAFCSLSVPESLREVLKTAANQVSAPHLFRQRDQTEGEWDGRMDVQGQWDGHFAALIRKHPYVLDYDPRAAIKDVRADHRPST